MVWQEAGSVRHKHIAQSVLLGKGIAPGALSGQASARRLFLPGKQTTVVQTSRVAQASARMRRRAASAGQSAGRSTRQLIGEVGLDGQSEAAPGLRGIGKSQEHGA